MIKRCSIYLTALALVAVSVGLQAKDAYLEEAISKQNDFLYSAFALIQDPRPKAPDFSLKDLNGDRVELRDTRGKVVLVSFRATW